MVDFSLHLKVPDDHNWLKNWNNLIQNLKILPMWREDSGRTPNTSNTLWRRNFFPIWPTYSALKRPILVKRSNSICILLIFCSNPLHLGQKAVQNGCYINTADCKQSKRNFFGHLVHLTGCREWKYKRTVSPHTLQEKIHLLRSSCFSHCGR